MKTGLKDEDAALEAIKKKAELIANDILKNAVDTIRDLQQKEGIIHIYTVSEMFPMAWNFLGLQINNPCLLQLQKQNTK